MCFQRYTVLKRSGSLILVAIPNYYFVSYLLYCSGCYLGVYTALGVTQALLVFFAVFALAIAAIFASRKLHARMLKNILRSPMSFFDTTPLGRVLNRFSKDIYTIDEVIPTSIRIFLYTLFRIISALFVIMIATPTFAIIIIPLGVFYLMVQVTWITGISDSVYRALSLMSITFSSSYTHFLSSVAFLCGHFSSAKASGVYHSLSHLLSLPGVPPGSIQHPGLPSARQVHEGE